MKKVTLKEFVSDNGAAETARQLGCSPAAITKAVKTERQIFVRRVRGGRICAEEIRPFPSSAHHTV